MSLSESKTKNKGLQNLLNNTWFYIGCLALLTGIIFAQFFFSNGMLFSSDQMSGFDAKVFLKTTMTQYHQFPMWFNSRLSGMPTIDALFGDPFYLPSMIMNFIFPVHSAISIKMIFHVFLAGVFFFLLLRKGFKTSPLIAITGAIFYMLNPQFFSHIYPGHDGKMYVIAWLPFVIWRIKTLVETPTLFNAALFCLGLSMSLLTSHIQMNYFVLWGLFFFWLTAAGFAFFSERNTKKGIFISTYFWGAIAVALTIAIVQYLPSYMFIKNAYSVRGVDRGFEFAASWALNWPEIISLWVPEFVNSLDSYWGTNPFKLNSEYAGAISIFLAVMAIVMKPSKWRYFWGGVALFALLFALGAHTPVFHIAYYLVPGVKKFRAASMIMFWFSFAVILLASLFLKNISEGDLSKFSEERKKRWVKGLLITNAVFLGIALLFSSKGFVSGFSNQFLLSPDKQNIFDLNFSQSFVPALWLWFLFATAVIIMLIAVIRKKLSANIAILCMLFIGFIDMYRIDSKFVKVIDPRPYFYSDPVLKDLASQMKTSPFRCFTLPGTLPQNSEGIHGLEGISGFHDNELKWYREFRGDNQDRNFYSNLLGFNDAGQPYLKAEKLHEGNPFLNLANVKYLLVRSGNQLLSIENKQALGRVSFARNYTVLDSNEVSQALITGKYDYRTTVALFQEPEHKPENFNTTDTMFTAEWEKYSPNHRVIKVKAPADGFLRISEIFYPGWELKIDGKPAPLYQADLTWMATGISKGEHIVEMKSHSIFLSKVFWLSLSTMFVLCLYAAIGGFFRLRKRG